MQYINNVVICGNLVKNAEVKRSDDEKGGFATFTIAWNSEHTNENGEKIKTPSFFDCIMPIKSTKITEYLTKGKGLVVQGSLKQNRWQGQDGSTRSKIVIRVSAIQFFPSSANEKQEFEEMQNARQQQNEMSEKNRAKREQSKEEVPSASDFEDDGFPF